MQLFWRRVFGHEEELETRLEGLAQNDFNQLTVGRLPCQGGKIIIMKTIFKEEGGGVGAR